MSMLAENIAQRRRALNLTQEELAVQVCVSRQTISEWENGASAPDLQKAARLANALDCTLDDMVSYDPQENHGLPLPPKGKHVFGTVTVGARGQIVIPKPARELFDIKQGDSLIVLADEDQGLAMLKADDYLQGVEAVRQIVQSSLEGETE